jgi:hypothetical protein
MLPLYVLHSYATNRDLFYLNQDFLIDAARANLPLKEVMRVLAIPYILRKVQTLDVYGGSEEHTVLDTWHMYYTVASNRHLPDTEFSRLYFGLPTERRRSWLAKLYVFLTGTRDYRHAEAYVLYFARNADEYTADQLMWACDRINRDQLPTTVSMTVLMGVRQAEYEELIRQERLKIERQEMEHRENQKLRKYLYIRTYDGYSFQSELTKPLQVNDYHFKLLSTETEFEHLGMVLGNCLGGYKYTLEGGELETYAAVYRNGQIYGAVEFRGLFTFVGQAELHQRRKFSGAERRILEEARYRYRERLEQLANPPAPPVSNTVCEAGEGGRTAVQVSQATTLRQNRVSAYGLPEPVPHGGLGYGGDRRSAVIGTPSDTMFVRTPEARWVDWDEYADGVIARRNRIFNDQPT